jgi:hypothetical protein
MVLIRSLKISTVLSLLASIAAESLYPENALANDADSCIVSDSESCPISEMSRDQNVVVYPGGETRCIFSTSSDFGFQVIPGDDDKLLIFFQGGGACWSEATTDADFCTTDAKPASLTGAFDRTDPSNPFQNYTIVHVLYCSGDLHAGNVTRPYNDKAGVPVQQRGFYNTQSVIDWIHANFKSQFSKVVLSGCSAGSLGVQAWADQVFDNLDYVEAAVIADSYAGVFPDNTQGPLIKEYGMCGVGVLEDDLLEMCEAEILTIQDVFEDAIVTNPNIAFSNLNSKADATQMSFYSAVAASFETTPLVLTPAEYEDAVNVIFERYNISPNYVSYFVTSSQHCYLPYSLMMTTDTTGTNGEGKGGQMTLLEWTSGFPVDSGASVSTQCDGEELEMGAWSGDTYCDAEQQGKTYTSA